MLSNLSQQLVRKLIYQAHKVIELQNQTFLLIEYSFSEKAFKVLCCEE